MYIYDYLKASAKAFLAEGKVFSDPVSIDAPGGSGVLLCKYPPLGDLFWGFTDPVKERDVNLKLKNG